METVKKLIGKKADELVYLSKKELLEYGKELNVVGRHNMTKEQLALQIVAKVDEAQRSNSDVTKTTEENTNGNNIKKGNNSDMSNPGNMYATKIRNNSDKRSKDDYINDVEVGAIIAFRVSESKVISAKVMEISFDKGKVTSVVGETRNGISYDIPRESIEWVKTGNRWPKIIFSMLKGPNYKEEYHKEKETKTDTPAPVQQEQEQEQEQDVEVEVKDVSTIPSNTFTFVEMEKEETEIYEVIDNDEDDWDD